MLRLILNTLFIVNVVYVIECFQVKTSELIPFTSTTKSPDGTTHYAITECALLRAAAVYLKETYGTSKLDSIPSRTDGVCDNVEGDRIAIDDEAKKLHISSSFRQAIYWICENNVEVDGREPFHPESHFDDESFTSASQLVKTRFDDAIAKLQNNDLSAARNSFGKAMHTTQDFYSHSNWIEIGNTKPNDFIGTGKQLGKYASRDMPTCMDCNSQTCRLSNILPNILREQWLTSGYFDLYSESKPNGKCSHGGKYDKTIASTATGFGINKDEVAADHGKHHYIAAQVAYDATLDKLNLMKSLVGSKMFGRFLGFNAATLAIVIDTTGSMGPYIELVKTMAIQIVADTASDDGSLRPYNYILSPFNDPTFGPLVVTQDPKVSPS